MFEACIWFLKGTFVEFKVYVVGARATRSEGTVLRILPSVVVTVSCRICIILCGFILLDVSLLYAPSVV